MTVRAKATAASVWTQHAEALADWALSREVVRRDVFGTYRPGGGPVTAHEALDRDVLVRHFRGERVIGVHSTNGESRCRWVAADIDAHTEQADAEANWRCALAAADGFARYGLHPLILDSNGAGGFHTKVWFKHTLDAAIVRWLCDQINADLINRGFDAPEWFPKQAGVTFDTPFGNWLRLPGKHHRRDHWTRVYDPAAPGWVEGRDATRRLIAVAGDHVGPVKKAYTEAHPPDNNGSSAREPRGRGHQPPPGPHDVERARGALACIPNDGEGLPYDPWLALGMALAELGDDGRRLWHEFSARSNKYDEGETDRKFSSFSSSGGITLGTLYHWAKQHGWKPTPDPEWRGQSERTSGPQSELSGDSQDWPDLVLDELPEAVPFPIDVYPEPVAAYVEAVGHICGGLDFPGGVVLAAAAGAIGRTLALRLKPGHIEHASVYLATVGPVGSGKSPAQDKLTVPLDRIVDRLEMEHDAVWKEWNDRVPKKGENKGLEPKAQRLVVTDCTIERLGMILYENPRGVIANADELEAFLAGIDQYKSSGGTGRSHLRSWWQSKTTALDRVKHGSRGIRVRSPVLSVVGGLPRDMLWLFKPKVRDGLLERFLFVFPDEVPRGDRRRGGVDDEAVESWATITKRLWAREMDYQDGFPVPALIGWPKEAEDVWDARIAKHDQEYDEEEGAMKGVWAKLDQYAGRFVVILAALRQASAKSFNPKTIPVATPEEVERAWKLVNYFKAMARRVEHQVSSGGLDTDALRVLGWIQTRRHIKEFSTADITYSIREYGKRKAALLMVMEQLERLCVVRKLPQPTREKTGRPPDPRYAVNPKLRKKKPIE